jgi:hypothetical protein
VHCVQEIRTNATFECTMSKRPTRTAHYTSTVAFLSPSLDCHPPPAQHSSIQMTSERSRTAELCRLQRCLPISSYVHFRFRNKRATLLNANVQCTATQAIDRVDRDWRPRLHRIASHRCTPLFDAGRGAKMTAQLQGGKALCPRSQASESCL